MWGWTDVTHANDYPIRVIRERNKKVLTCVLNTESVVAIVTCFVKAINNK